MKRERPASRTLAALALPFGLVAAAACAKRMTIDEYEPKSALVVPENPRPHAKYPFIDVHSHLDALMKREDLDKVVKDMDRIRLRVLVNLSGGTGETLKKGVENMKGAYPDRFVLFANVDFDDIDDPDFGRKAALRLAADVKNGAQGLKIFKNLGLTLKDGTGARVPVDDPRLDPIWAKAGELGIPVLIHSGEPKPFFDPLDKSNERWLELTQFPDRFRPPHLFPTFEGVMGEQHRLFAKHPKTTFINAHLGWLGNDLGRLGRLLDERPNVVTEIGAVLAELGRQPRAAREFFIRYQDRVLMGKDLWGADEYAYYFRCLETKDEYFDYYRKRHAHWKIYGLDLPDEVLRKVYFENALRVVPGIDARAFASS